MLEWLSVACPYCGALFETAVDGSAGERQEYTEDCQVCCSPILFSVHVDPDGRLLAADTRRENE
jgi:hypothetical protein